MGFTLELFNHAKPDRFGVNALGWQEHDGELGCPRRIYVFVAYVPCKPEYQIAKLFLGRRHLIGVGGIVCVHELQICVRGEFGIYWQPDGFIAVSGQPYGIFHTLLGFALCVEVFDKLLRRQYFLKYCAELNLAENAACLDV